MTNLQQVREKGDLALEPPAMKLLWFWGPIGVGGVVSLLILLAVALPQWLAISRVQRRVSELEQFSQQVELLRQQSLKSQEEQKRAQRQQAQLIELVTGRGDLATFLATLDLEARQSGVVLQLYEPTAEPAPGTAAGPRGASTPSPQAGPADRVAQGALQGQGEAPPAPPPDVLRDAGLRERTLLLSARGTYPRLLAFLRRMEMLEVLVEQKDLTLGLAETDPGHTPSKGTTLPDKIPEVEVKLSLTLWSKDPEGHAKKVTPPPPPAPPG